jgi:hypothetical protein
MKYRAGAGGAGVKFHVLSVMWLFHATFKVNDIGLFNIYKTVKSRYQMICRGVCDNFFLFFNSPDDGFFNVSRNMLR